ncbi:maintenance of mitochondrial structure and function-domain-containing protein [Hyaloraphidium curvatum]|nr:maintenance of mitochondrial structure and function-domain-containing protein [Hyaloraphidium curvatum]
MSAEPPAGRVDGVVSKAPNSSGLSITLHPLVIMNVSDHFTRTKAQTETSSPTVLGALLGIQKGRDVEIFNSFEVPFKDVDGKMEIDKTYFTTKQEQLRQVFKDFDFLGWYSTGPEPTAAEIHVHEQFLTFNESPLYVQLFPNVVATSKDLPIAVYESVIDLVDGRAQTLFVRSQYRVETMEAERIAVNHVAKAAVADASEGSGVIQHLVGQKNAIKMLHSRIGLLYQYVKDVEDGKVARDHNMMRQISSLCCRLPTIDSPQFRQEFLTDVNDVLLTSYLAVLTKGCNAISDVVDKFNLTSGDKRRMRGPAAFYG